MEMREGSLWKKIMVYSIPLMFSNLLQILFNLSDIAVVGKCAGPISLGAVGSTAILVTLTTGFLIGMSNGVNALTALFVGSNDYEKEKKCVHTSFTICFITGLCVLLLGLFFSRPVLTVLHTKDELMDEALIYFRIYVLGSPGLALFNYGNGVLSAVGDTKKPLRYLTISGIINVILNLIFVIVFKMTASGVALASIIAQYIAAFLVIKELMKTTGNHRLNLKQVKIDRVIAGRLLKLGVPSMIQYSLFAVANLVIQASVNSFDHVVVEGHSAASNADGLVYDMMAAFYTACTSFIAQNYGANKKDRVLKTYGITTLYSFGIGLVLGVLIYIFRDGFLGLFTNDDDVIKYGTVKLSIMTFSYCVSAFMDNSIAAARGLGKTTVPTVIVIMGTVVFRIIWIYTVFAYFRTLESIYILYVCAWVFTAIAGNIYLYKEYRKIFN